MPNSGVSMVVRLDAAPSIDELVDRVPETLRATELRPTLLMFSRSTSGGVCQRIEAQFPELASSAVIRERAIATGLAQNVLGRAKFTDVEIGCRGSRLSVVSMVSRLTEGMPFVVNDLRGETNIRPRVVIDLWSSFVSAGLTIGSWASNPGEGLRAEIALAAPHAVYFIVDKIGKTSISIIGTDMVAVELMTLALRWAGRNIGVDTGPWEDPLIQHATDLQLGIHTPGELQICYRIDPSLDSYLTDSICSVFERSARRIGVDSISISRD